MELVKDNAKHLFAQDILIKAINITVIFAPANQRSLLLNNCFNILRIEARETNNMPIKTWALNYSTRTKIRPPIL